jgi:glycosyltransferase involved in cell wall biosynthesis
VSFLVAIPVYNELRYARHVFEQVLKYADHVLAIDDGSTDGTADLLRTIAGLHVVSHRRNLGYGQTILGGFAYAIKHGYQTLVTLDCDLQHDPRRILDFVAEAERFDIVSGSRYLPESQVLGDPPPPERLAINQATTRRINEITGYRLTDVFCGYKAYRTRSLRQLRLHEPGYALPLQLWIQAWKHGLTVTELPVDLIYRDLSRAFVGSIADAERRLAYYNAIIDRELARP